MKNLGDPYKLAKILFPINRSLTGKGNYKTLKILKKINNLIKIKSFKVGEKVFDWKIPPVWNTSYAYLKKINGEVICDFKKNNLHLLGYSISIDKKFKFKELSKNLFFIKKYPQAIPYVTSYYKKNWGFCLSYNQYKKMDRKSKYHAVIKTDFNYKGNMNYGEALIKGKDKREIVLSSYICHPSMANNETSGIVVLSFLLKWLNSFKKLKYSYRFLFIPETIGSIAYVNKHYKKLKKNILTGIVITCVGDNGPFSLLKSKYNNAPGDKIIERHLRKKKIHSKIYNWSDRGSDERQFCSPNVDLPFSSFMRSKYGEYKQYHTSEDNMNFISKKGLQDSILFLQKIILNLENSNFWRSRFMCEPMLSKRKLYPTISKASNNNNDLLDILTWCDGKNSEEDISEITKIKGLKSKIAVLKKNKLIY